VVTLLNVFAPKLVEVSADKPKKVVDAGAGPVQIRNRDELVTVYLGDEDIDPTSQVVAILDPLGSQSVDGKKDIWAMTLPGTSAIVNAIPTGLSGEVSPAAIAAQIYGQSVPLARKPINLGNGSGDVAAATIIPLLSAAPVTQPAYQLYLFLQADNSGTTIPFCKLHMKWTDTSSGLMLDLDQLLVPVGFPSFCDVFVTGPAREDQITLTLENLDPSVSVSYTYTCTQTSQVYTELRAIQGDTNTMPTTLSKASQIPQFGVLYASAPTIMPGTPSQHIANTWTGSASLAIDNTGQANAVLVQVLDPGIALGGSAIYTHSFSGIFASVQVAAGAIATALIALPNGPVVLKITNLGTTGAISPSVILVRNDK